jgi:hypothetical protein
MKKIGLLAISLLFLVGCTPKAIPVEEAAQQLTDRLVYQKQAAEFEENFVDGATLAKSLDQNSAEFERSFAQGLAVTGGTIPQEQAQALTDTLMKQVREKTSFTVKKLSEEDGIGKVEIEVKGLDFVSVMGTTAKELTDKMLKDAAFAKDDQKVLTETVTLLEKNLQAASAKEEAQALPLTLASKDGKWQIPEDQQPAVENLYLAFISGEKDQSALSAAMAEMVQEIAKEIQK